MNIFTAVKYCCILHGRVFVMDHEKGYVTSGPIVFRKEKIFLVTYLNLKQIKYYKCACSSISTEFTCRYTYNNMGLAVVVCLYQRLS